MSIGTIACRENHLSVCGGQNAATPHKIARMNRRPSDGIGARVANYRRLAGLTAQQLSDKLGGDISRGVIANIETGRKTDLTVDQVIALAWALEVPFVALALPMDKPFHWLTIAEGSPQMSHVSMRGWTLAGWMMDRPVAFTGENNRAGANPAGIVARTLLRSLDELWLLEREVAGTKALMDEDPGAVSEKDLRAVEAKLEQVTATLVGLGVDLTEESF